MIPTYLIVSTITLGLLALAALFLGVVGNSCGVTLASAILSFILAFIFICNELQEIGFLTISIAWIIMGFSALFDDDIGISGAIILWIIGGVCLWTAIQGNSNKEQPDCTKIVRTILQNYRTKYYVFINSIN